MFPAAYVWPHLGTMMMGACQAGAQWCATPPPPEDTECRLMQTLTLLLRSRAMPGSHTGPHLSCCGRTRVRQLRAEPLHCRQEEAHTCGAGHAQLDHSLEGHQVLPTNFHLLIAIPPASSIARYVIEGIFHGRHHSKVGKAKGTHVTPCEQAWA